MSALIALFTIVDIMLAVLLVVVSMARMDRRYAAKVRAEYDRKSMLRGRPHRKDDR